MAMTIEHHECPPKADLRKMMDECPLPVITPDLVGATVGGEAEQLCLQIIDRPNTALRLNDSEAVQDCFHDTHAWWKDSLALTYHLRTFTSPRGVAAALLETKRERGLCDIELDGGAHLIPAGPTLQFIDCGWSFRTTSPAATCSGKLLLLPTKDSQGSIQWKIWILSSRLKSLDSYPEDENLLQSPKKQFDGLQTLRTEVCIIGAGNAAIALAARLKAMGVDSLMVEKNRNVGDNWALRYDSMRFHIPTSFCELPYMTYDESLHTPHLLSRMELAEQVKRYVEAFQLNAITSASIMSTSHDTSRKLWKVNIKTPAGLRTIVSKHLVMATGVSSQKPNMPRLDKEGVYRGLNIHSVMFKNGRELADKGVKSVIVVGSDNTAFDVLEDCHASGLKATMNVRSPTYICPLEHVCDKRSLGAYDSDVAAADNLFMSLPAIVDGALAKGLFAMMASEEPDRYTALRDAGFPVLTGMDKSCALMYNLIERGGGHYVDVGGTKLISNKQVDIKANVEPTAYTESGLQFSDGSTLDADAVIWCASFSDKDVSQVTAEILGGLNDSDSADDGLIQAKGIAARMDSTWGIDKEGEIRGMWKRHSRLEETNFWIMGGYTQQHRFHSRTLALQIKAELEGILPPAYRDTPGSA